VSWGRRPGPAAEANAAARGIDREDDDIHIGADAKRLGNVRVLRHSGFAHADEAGSSRSEEHEHAEVLVLPDLAREARAGHGSQPAGVGPGHVNPDRVGASERTAIGRRRALREGARPVSLRRPFMSLA